MSDGKRRDKKGRILITGEYQDAAGRYSYKYTNSMGRRKVVCSWRLTQADVTPLNRKGSKPLRDQEKEIQRFLLRGIYAEDMSVCNLGDRYLATKTGVRHNTEAKLFWIKLQSDGKGYSTIHSVRSVLRPAFQMVVYILFYKGMRISEFCGLTLKDIDLEGRTVNIDHQLQRTYDMRYVIEETKNDAGKRKISITEDVPQMFQAIIEDREPPKMEKVIDGHPGFLFYDVVGNPLVAMYWQHRFNRMVGRYNDIYRVQMPNITPYVCRHTYCSNMAKSGMNPKTLQYLMGHSDISVTMNVYMHIGFDDAEEELKRMEEFRKAQDEIEKKNDAKTVSQKRFRVV